MIQSDITTICQTKSKRTDATSLTNMKSALNEAVHWLCDEFVLTSGVPIDCLKTLKTYSIVEGDYYKALESDFVSLLEDDPVTLINGSDETPMDKKTPAWFVDNYPVQSHASAAKEEPAYYYIEGGRIYFNKSNSAYSIKMPYSKRHESIASDATTILFPDSYKYLLAYLTLSFFFEDLDNEEQSAKYLKKAQTQLVALGLINKRNTDVPRHTKYNDI